MAELIDVVNVGSQLPNIGFAEFTTNLVLSVFDGLVAANVNQTQSYIQLLQSVSKDLTQYVNDTKDDIGGDQVLQFLAAVLPKDTDGTPMQVTPGSKADMDPLKTLNTSLAVTELTNENKLADADVASGTQSDVDLVIAEAVAKRIAADKYALLTEMVKQGVLRLVVTSGIIETKLLFSVSVSKFYQSNSTSFDRKAFNFAAAAKTGRKLARWVQASASADYQTVSVNTSNATQSDNSGSSVNIFGLVHLEFKTDYLPLNK